MGLAVRSFPELSLPIKGVSIGLSRYPTTLANLLTVTAARATRILFSYVRHLRAKMDGSIYENGYSPLFAAGFSIPHFLCYFYSLCDKCFASYIRAALLLFQKKIERK